MRSLKYSKKEIQEAVRDSKNYREVASKLNPDINPAYAFGWLKKRIERLKIDVSHFVRSKKRPKYSKEKLEEIVKISDSISDVLRELDLVVNSSTRTYMKKWLRTHSMKKAGMLDMADQYVDQQLLNNIIVETKDEKNKWQENQQLKINKYDIENLKQ